MAVYVLISADCHSLSIWQLCTQYNIVTTLKGLSGIGCKYTMELGMNIGVAEQSVWKEYITVCFIINYYPESDKN
ncbi:hypothetical protein L208DRAFT_1391719 [Tricholoma matsutake]|nr:hypothetical protein L208DRAFT_1391719 [Tricholoma matsutake 945]